MSNSHPTRLLIATVCAIAALACAPPVPALDFGGAQWLWHVAGADLDLNSLPAEACYMRGALTLPDGYRVASARLAITCDNLYIAYLNGKPVGESEANNGAWGKPGHWDVTGLLVPGRNVLAVEAVNTLPGAAGLIAKLEVDPAEGGGRPIVLVSDAAWMSTGTEAPGWRDRDFDDTHWNNATVMAPFGGGPWGRVAVPAAGTPPTPPSGAVRAFAQRSLREAVRQGRQVIVSTAATPAAADFAWPAAIAYVGNDCSLGLPPGGGGTAYQSLSVTIFNPRNSRAFPEHDLPAPMKIGHTLYTLSPARPGVAPRVLLDAGPGAIGSPSVTFDGDAVLIAMAAAGDAFFHIYRVPTDGGAPRRLTDGPFHDIDPCELPDGRIVFTSTRIGTFEEYHNPPSRSLFMMNADGGELRPLTYSIIFDNEPEVLADGRILCVRSDNFFDRGKVETRLHAIHPDGSTGYTAFGLDVGPEYGGRLRAYYCGSPAPMPDGRVAFLTAAGIAVGRPGSISEDLRTLRIAAGDVAALPDGRLLCTTGRNAPNTLEINGHTRNVTQYRYDSIGLVDPDAARPTFTPLLTATNGFLHSPVYLGPRPRPSQLADIISPADDAGPPASGVLYCQNVRNTKNSTAGWSHVRAVRVLAGHGLTMRSSHSYIVHAGSDVTELGTVPLAPDGSFAVEVPADTPIAFQMVDAEGRSELNEMSWIYVRPGEHRGCIGCHAGRQSAPDGASIPLAPAADTPPLLASRAGIPKLTGTGTPLRFRGNNAAVTGLMNMQFDRYREVAGINRHDAANPNATGRDEIAALIAALANPDDEAAAAVANRLAVFRDPMAAPALAACLTRRRPAEVRRAAAMALAACGTRDSIAPLLDALTDREPCVAQAAAIAIENLTGREIAFDGYATLDARRAQTTALRDRVAPERFDAIEQSLLQALTDDKDRDAVRRAAVALGHTGGPAACAPLRAYLLANRDDNPLPAWRRAGHRGDAARFNSLSPVNPRTLQAVTRALGYLRDADAVPLLAETLRRHALPATGNLFLAEACAEALGRIGTPEAERALIETFAALRDYPEFTSWYGDHGALMACHASPTHYYIMEALDTLASTNAVAIVPHIIRSVPIDPDRALLPPNDDYETLAGRIIRRNGAGPAVVDTCLAILGDESSPAAAAPELRQALAHIHRCWAGHPTPEMRAAQILALTARDRRDEPRIRAAFERYRAKPTTIARVFDTGIPVVDALPLKHWVCFYLARALGNLGDTASVDTLIASLTDAPPEAAAGSPDPLGPGVLFLHNDLTPCWRAEAAWALGRIGNRRAVPALIVAATELRNAPDTRHAAAEALTCLDITPAERGSIAALAADYPDIATRRVLGRAAVAP